MCPNACGSSLQWRRSTAQGSSRDVALEAAGEVPGVAEPDSSTEQ